MPSNVREIEDRLRNAEHELGLYTDNRNLIASKLEVLRRDLSKLQLEEHEAIDRQSKPLEREQAELNQEQKEYERAREKFAAAEDAFKKAQQDFEREQTGFAKVYEANRRSAEGITRKFNVERTRVEQEIDRREQEERGYMMKVENARRNIELLRRRLEDAHRQEMEQMKRSAANTNNRPMSGRMSPMDTRRYASDAANSNYAPDTRRYGT
jgi:chromosome segregation ATPase